MFTRDDAKNMRSAMEAALQGVAKQFGASVDINGIRFGENMKVTVEYHKVGKNGVDETAKAEWERYAPSFDLKKDMFGKTFNFHGDVFKITGLSLRGRRFPVLATNNKGKGFKFTANTILSAKLGAGKMPPAPFAKGDKVEAEFAEGWFKGIVVSMHRGNVTIKFSDGDVQTFPLDDVRKR